MNKIIFLAIGLCFSFGVSLHAGDEHGDHFAEAKAQHLEQLNAEKAIVDKMISCVSSCQKHEDMKKCHEEKRAAMQVQHEKSKDMRRKHLQDELKKIDEAPPKK